MKKKTKKPIDSKSDSAVVETVENTVVKAIQAKRITVRIVGTSPIIANKWSEKAKQMMAKKGSGDKTSNRDARDTDAEFKAAMHLTSDGKHGVPVMAIKTCIINAAHKDLGIEKTLVRKALFVGVSDPSGVIPFDKHSKPWMREDPMRIGRGSVMLRYRPQYDTWSLIVTFEIDSSLLTIENLLNLITRAGFGVGLLEGRPEKGRDFGRFKLDLNYKANVENIPVYDFDS